ncbi:MAG: helix-turn-helix domain-containing protein [Nakamurella sp.]
MTDHADESHPTRADATASKPRRRLLTLLRRSETPLDVYDLATATGLHITTVRFHLDVLARAGLITVQTLPRTTPGRPRTVYMIRVEEPTVDAYHPLAAVLAANLGRTPGTRRRRAEKAGRDWAATLVPVPDEPLDHGDSAAEVTAIFARMGFDPELHPPAEDTGARDIRLRGCPYRDLAQSHPEVICAIHLGLLQGTLAQLDGPPTTAQLLPFVKPRLCVVRLTPNPPAPPGYPRAFGTQPTTQPPGTPPGG